MPANRFATDRIVVGHEQDARIIDRILQAILGRWPIEKCDISSVFSAAIDWSDGALVPIDNINVDELFNNATGIAAALGCMDFLNGLAIGYVDGTTINITPGHVLHRGDFKRVECVDDLAVEIGTVNLLADDDCAPIEGNPSGLDADTWYFVYGNMNAAGPTPTVTSFVKLSEKAPVKCEGKGWEHPTLKYYRFLGTIRTMDTGVIRPFDRVDNGWLFWRTAEVSSDYQTAGYGDAGTNLGFVSLGYVDYNFVQTTVAYHDADKHIPVTADIVQLAGHDDDNGCAVRAEGWDGIGFPIYNQGAASAAGMVASIELPVNLPGATPQVFELDSPSANLGNGHLDVVGYHERLQ